MLPRAHIRHMSCASRLHIYATSPSRYSTFTPRRQRCRHDYLRRRFILIFTPDALMRRRSASASVRACLCQQCARYKAACAAPQSGAAAAQH